MATPPVRIVHLGLGAFHRSHQAWCTAKAADAASWGIPEFIVWIFADFGLGPCIHRVDGNRKGVFTRERKPKSAAFYLPPLDRSRRPQAPANPLRSTP
ncbi:hypothetical protein O1R50_25555 [Glycomyces luteolus]|uniref:Mannitol dehydrogenase-like protein n=1 Tax=Glycomyces luteolus TaxID=2670330 RepID=A0A9X3PPZ3_9ACTN|nr:hypothetical protein [Glycomyces luteolus]MDA1363005.1 hypothetical protein [Glycomyces luteolus]